MNWFPVHRDQEKGVARGGIPVSVTSGLRGRLCTWLLPALAPLVIKITPTNYVYENLPFSDTSSVYLTRRKSFGLSDPCSLVVALRVDMTLIVVLLRMRMRTRRRREQNESAKEKRNENKEQRKKSE